MNRTRLSRMAANDRWRGAALTKEQEALMAYLEGLAADPKRAKVLHKVLLEERSMLLRTGWIESFINGNSSWQGELVPWFNYGVIRFLAGRVGKHMRVFEYGAGYSTLWWERRAASVMAVEHDESWAARVSELVKDKTVIRYVPLEYDGAYCRTILETDNHYDVVVVDGRDRVNCMRQSLARLNNDGVIVFDNSQRGYYRAGIEELKSNGFREIQFSGIAPMTHVESFTSILYRPDNCFKI
jgi:hypothetical protein